VLIHQYKILFPSVLEINEVDRQNFIHMKKHFCVVNTIHTNVYSTRTANMAVSRSHVIKSKYYDVLVII